MHSAREDILRRIDNRPKAVAIKNLLRTDYIRPNLRPVISRIVESRMAQIESEHNREISAMLDRLDQSYAEKAELQAANLKLEARLIGAVNKNLITSEKILDLSRDNLEKDLLVRELQKEVSRLKRENNQLTLKNAECSKSNLELSDLVSAKDQLLSTLEVECKNQVHTLAQLEGDLRFYTQDAVYKTAFLNRVLVRLFEIAELIVSKIPPRLPWGEFETRIGDLIFDMNKQDNIDALNALKRNPDNSYVRLKLGTRLKRGPGIREQYEKLIAALDGDHQDELVVLAQQILADGYLDTLDKTVRSQLEAEI
jgi:predicted Zn-ribbon and HTH transcriptional regulator